MEHLRPDLHSPAAEKTASSNYYTYTRPSQNGYTSIAVVPSPPLVVDETSDTEFERAGVFDYVLSPSQHTNNRSLPSTISTAAIEDECGIQSSRQKWAQGLSSQTDGTCNDNGTELTTFSYNSSDTRSQPTNDGSYGNGAGEDVKTDADNCSELEEIVVHSEMQSHRATYERFNPDFPYAGLRRSPLTHEPATVFVTSINKSSSQNSSRAIDTSDERDVIERRSRHYTPPRKSATLFHFHFLCVLNFICIY